MRLGSIIEPKFRTCYPNKNRGRDGRNISLLLRAKPGTQTLIYFWREGGVPTVPFRNDGRLGSTIEAEFRTFHPV